MNTDDVWLFRIEQVMFAHFRREGGDSVPGGDWIVGLKKGDDIRQIQVRALLHDGTSAATREDTDYQAQTVAAYVSDILSAGWTPDEPREHLITIVEPARD